MESELKPEKPLMTWKALSRPFKRRSREFYINLFSVAGLLGLIIFLIEGVVPVILIASLLFMFYVFSTIEPESVEYSLTTYGVRINGQIIKYWEEMGLYWFSKRMDHETLIIETNTVPWKIEMVIDAKDKEKIEEIVSKRLYKNDNPDTNIDKVVAWFGNKIKV